MSLAIAILGLIAAIASAAAAVGAWTAARRSNQTASDIAAIERARRHEELTPKFEFTVVGGYNSIATLGDDAALLVSLVGGILELDTVEMFVLDETGQDHWARGLPQGVTREEAAEFVWGPWQFDTGATDQVINKRRTKPRPYSRPDGRNWDRLALQRTMAGRWMSPQTTQQWRDQHRGPIRLAITCAAAGYQPWTVTYEVPPAGW